MTQERAQERVAERPTPVPLIVLAWLIVAVPLAYGLWQTLVKAAALLTG